jgi:alanyl aminopeptidase
LRKGVLPFVANMGDDEGLQAEARRLAEAWLENRSAVDPDMVSSVLETAALEGDRALFDRFLAEAKRSGERRDRILLLTALGTFRDPVLRAEALSLYLTDTFPILESAAIVRGAAFSESPEVREGAWQFLKANYDAIVAKIPPEARGALPSFATGFCDEARRAEIEAFFRERVATLSGGPRNLAKTLERISQCEAFRKTAEPEVKAFLDSGAGGATTARP